MIDNSLLSKNINSSMFMDKKYKYVIVIHANYVSMICLGPS